jgi:hypothetical protein
MGGFTAVQNVLVSPSRFASSEGKCATLESPRLAKCSFCISGSRSLQGRHFELKLILLAVGWYLRTLRSRPPFSLASQLSRIRRHDDRGGSSDDDCSHRHGPRGHDRYDDGDDGQISRASRQRRQASAGLVTPHLHECTAGRGR